MSISSVQEYVLNNFWLWGIVLFPMAVYLVLLVLAPVLHPVVELFWTRQFFRDVRIVKRASSWHCPRALELDTSRWEDDGGS